MADDPRYIDAWKRYRTWSRLRLTAFLGWLPYGIGVMKVTKWLGAESQTPQWILAWFFLVGAGVIGAGMFECPRCGKPFFFSWSWKNLFASQCVHCGLPKWAARDPADEPQRSGAV
jgi:hypothetical protein